MNDTTKEPLMAVDHLVYEAENGEPEDCIDECPGCHAGDGCADPEGCDLCATVTAKRRSREVDHG